VPEQKSQSENSKTDSAKNEVNQSGVYQQKLFYHCHFQPIEPAIVHSKLGEHE